MNVRRATTRHVRLAVTLAVAALFALTAPAQEYEEEFEAEESPPFAGLDEIEAEADEVFDDEVRAFCAEELGEALRHIEAMEEEAGQGRLEPHAVFELYDMKIMLGHRLRELYEAKRHNGEAYERLKTHLHLEVRSHMLSRAYQEAETGDEKQRIAAELREVLTQGFQAAQEMRELEAERIERELEEVWTLLEQRKAHKDVIIERRYQELLHGRDPFEW